MLCDEPCPNPATVTLYKHDKKADVCKAHQYIYKQLGYKEKVLDTWDTSYEKLPTENVFRNLIKKVKRKK